MYLVQNKCEKTRMSFINSLCLSRCVNAHPSDRPPQRGQGLRQRQLCSQRGAFHTDRLFRGLLYPIGHHGGDILPHHTGNGACTGILTAPSFFSCESHNSRPLLYLHCLLALLFLRCSRGRPRSSCTRQRLPPSSLCTHQQ